MSFDKEDFKWTDKPVIGIALGIMGGSIDSFGKAINPLTFYNVGKHKESGKVVLIPSKKIEL